MSIIFTLLTLALIFAIAAAAIGREAKRLDAEAPYPVFDIEQAVQWVADHLPFEVTAELTHDDVRKIIDLNMEYFRSKGLSGNGSSPRVQGPVVIGGAETVDYVMTRAQALGATFTAAQVHAVLDAQMGYLQVIGAIGPEASGEDTGGLER